MRAGELEVRHQHFTLRPTRCVEDLVHGLGGLDALVGVPMHATILATSQCVPTLALYYEGKGLDYLEQLGLGRHAHPICELAADDGVDRTFNTIRKLWDARDEVRDTLETRLPRLRARAAYAGELLTAALEKE